jgi:hypothetical protein
MVKHKVFDTPSPPLQFSGNPINYLPTPLLKNTGSILDFKPRCILIPEGKKMHIYIINVLFKGSIAYQGFS